MGGRGSVWLERRAADTAGPGAGLTKCPRNDYEVGIPVGALGMITQIDAAAFNTQLRQLTTPADCGALFARAILPFGFDTFASGEVDLQDRSRCAFHIINWPERWATFYRTSGLIDNDPVVEALTHRTAAFTWTDLRADRSFSRLGTAALDLARASGWNEGFVVPLPQASGRIGLVSLAGTRDCTDPGERDYLTLISVCLHSHVRTLLGRHGFAISPAGLTPREIDTLRLVARGMSDAAIGRALGIASSTAHEFVEKAKRKMKVRSRAELAALATSLAIVDI